MFASAPIKMVYVLLCANQNGCMCFFAPIKIVICVASMPARSSNVETISFNKPFSQLTRVMDTCNTPGVSWEVSEPRVTVKVSMRTTAWMRMNMKMRKRMEVRMSKYEREDEGEDGGRR